MHLLLVAGARPNFMKVAPILRAARAAGHRATLVHTGQHYDHQMSAAFFADLGMPDPEYHLGVDFPSAPSAKLRAEGLPGISASG